MTKTELHRLVDDDEELTDEDRRAIQKSQEEPGIAWSEVEAELNAG